MSNLGDSRFHLHCEQSSRRNSFVVSRRPMAEEIERRFISHLKIVLQLAFGVLVDAWRQVESSQYPVRDIVAIRGLVVSGLSMNYLRRELPLAVLHCRAKTYEHGTTHHKTSLTYPE